MTALSTPATAGSGRDMSLRPVPWRRMAWVTWRQHRVALAGVAALLGALAVYMLFDGLNIHRAYAAMVACHPADSFVCDGQSSYLNSTLWARAQVVAALLQFVPALIGAFVGAPILAREMESGTFRFAWTQGFGRARWAVAKLVLLAVAVTAAAGAFSQLFSWYYSSFLAEGQQASFTPQIFDLRGVAFAAWTLTAFAIGVLAGMLIRRVVAAMAATLAVYGGLFLGTTLFLRKHYMAPLVTKSTGNWLGQSLIIGQWWTGPNGKPVSQSTIDQLIMNNVPPPTPRQVGQGKFDPFQWLFQHGYTQWTSYQPATRYWPFQFIEGGWLLALSLLLIAAAVWLVRRRAA